MKNHGFLETVIVDWLNSEITGSQVCFCHYLGCVYLYILVYCDSVYYILCGYIFGTEKFSICINSSTRGHCYPRIILFFFLKVLDISRFGSRCWHYSVLKNGGILRDIRLEFDTSFSTHQYTNCWKIAFLMFDRFSMELCTHVIYGESPRPQNGCTFYYWL